MGGPHIAAQWANRRNQRPRKKAGRPATGAVGLVLQEPLRAAITQACRQPEQELRGFQPSHWREWDALAHGQPPFHWSGSWGDFPLVRTSQELTFVLQASAGCLKVPLLPQSEVSRSFHKLFTAATVVQFLARQVALLLSVGSFCLGAEGVICVGG